MLLLVILLLAVTVLPGPVAAQTGVFAGRASVIDGDTVEVQRQRIRLFGIDAPESAQLCKDAVGKAYRCGQMAANALSELIRRRPISCTEVNRDRYGRAVAVCSVEGVDLADWMVRNGFAFDWPQHSKGGYVEAQAEAQNAKRGVWAGTSVAPWDYRACTQRGGRPADCSDIVVRND